MKKGSLILAILVGVLSIGIVAYADTLWNTHTTYGTAVDGSHWTGYYVQYDSGISATQEWADAATMLSWNIQLSGGIYTYEYTFSTPAGGGEAISHFILELTNDTTISPIDINPANQTYYGTWTGGPGNPGLPGSGFYGVKFETDVPDSDLGEVFTFSFNSTEAPVWGNFYAKDGGGTGAGAVVAWNTGLEDPESGVFIARPDGLQVPEPMTLMLLGAGLLGLVVIRRRK